MTCHIRQSAKLVYLHLLNFQKSQNGFEGNERRKRHFLLRFIGQLTMDHHQFSVFLREEV